VTSRIIKTSLGFFFFLITTNVFAQLNLLEEYNFQLGASGGSELLFHDPSLGNGNAQMRFQVFPISIHE
jgi:hypothetical protein